MTTIPATPGRRGDLLIHSLLLITVFFWGMAFVFIKQALLFLTPAELTLLRFGLAGLAFLLYLLLFPAARVPVAQSDWGRFLLLGFLGVPGYHLALNFGERWISASTASLIIALNPILTALLSAVLAGERPGWQAIAGIGVALAGFVSVLAAQGGPLFGASSAWGVGLVLFAAIDWSFYSVLAKPLFRRYPSTTVTAYATLAGAVMLLPLLRPALFVKAAHLPAPTWGAVLFLSLLSAFFGYLAWYYALARREAAQVAVYIYLNPLFAVLGSRWLLKEPLTLPLLAGGALILVGVALANRPRPRAKEEAITKKVPVRAGNPDLP
jgi:drug/metabolite transporter (DMT)-like permease